MPDTQTYSAKRIFTGKEWLYNHTLHCADGRIVDVLPSETPAQYDSIIPAFIDLQLYGAEGRLLSVYPDAATVAAIDRYCRGGGARWFQPTVATNTTEVFHRAIDAVRSYWNNGGKGCLGLHVEGPWIHPAKRGAHIESLVREPSIDEVRSLMEYGKGVIRMVTLAPEVCAVNIIRLIRSYGVTISAGHSNASFAEATSAFDNGIGVVTHLYNAMSALQHRAPGMVGACFLHKNVMASVIADGHHVDYAAIKIAHAMMKDRLFLITDAVTDTSTGPYPHQLAGDKYEASGILSGSAVTMIDSVRNLIHCGIDPTDAIRMATILPAKAIGMTEEIGVLTAGANASFIITDEELRSIQLVEA